MASKKRKLQNPNGFPNDDRPIIFNLIDSKSINYIGRYIESQGIFMLSLNDETSDFVHKEDVDEWTYVNEHPIVVSETLNGKSKTFKKSKSSKKENEDIEDDLVVDPMNFIIPSILSDFIQHLGQTMGINSDSIQVRVVGVDDLNNLPKPVLEQLLEKAVEDENFELASKVRDAIKTTGNNETN